MAEHKCEGKVRGDWRSFSCAAGAKYETNGKWYCGRHEPGKVAARKAKLDAKRAEASAARSRRWNTEDARKARRDACEAAFAGREIATEKITEGLVWQLRDALARLVADYQDVPDATDVDGQAVFANARALLAKLEE